MSSRRPVIWVAQGFWVEPIYHGIAKYAAEQGWIVDAGMRWMRGRVQPPSRKPDGIIVFTGPISEIETMVKDFAVPTVDLEDYGDRYGAPKVLGDDRAIGRMAARHLAAAAPDRLVAITESYAIGSTRMQEFRDEAAAAGIPVVTTSRKDFDPLKIRAGGTAGVFANGDNGALEILHRCLEAGVSVPDDIAILGCDDTEDICNLAPVPLSSIRVEFENKGRIAAEMLGRLMAGEKKPGRPVIVPPSGVTVRASTRAENTGNCTLDRLMRHLRENAHRPVGVDTLCEECGVPPRTAQHLLKHRLNTTPLALLTRFRLENAERLARSGKLKQDALARASGFGSRSAFSRAKGRCGTGLRPVEPTPAAG